MPGLQGLVQLVVLVGECATLERFRRQTQARHERRTIAFDEIAIGVGGRVLQRAVHTLDLWVEGLVDTRDRVSIRAEMRSCVRHSGRSRQMPMRVEGDVDVDCNGQLPPQRGNNDFIIGLCTTSRPLRCRPAGTQDPPAKKSAHRPRPWPALSQDLTVDKLPFRVRFRLVYWWPSIREAFPREKGARSAHRLLVCTAKNIMPACNQWKPSSCALFDGVKSGPRCIPLLIRLLRRMACRHRALLMTGT